MYPNISPNNFVDMVKGIVERSATVATVTEYSDVPGAVLIKPLGDAFMRGALIGELYHKLPLFRVVAYIRDYDRDMQVLVTQFLIAPAD